MCRAIELWFIQTRNLIDDLPAIPRMDMSGLAGVFCTIPKYLCLRVGMVPAQGFLIHLPHR